MFILLLALWIVFNGKFTWEIFIIGAILSGLVCFFLVKFAGYSFKKEFKAIKLIPDLLSYAGILLIEILKCNFAVIGITLFRPRGIKPVIVHFKTRIRSKVLKVILANSITLTPGTITASLHDDEFYVHCLDRAFAEGIESSVFVRRLERMEERL
ncbi:MAG: Na+/H+ antiporter subunit E [Lachnospiraceae bacterium]|nr:Na+/H+ antiporter subunit E [Lachnospiraceae bacterium]